MPRILQPLWLFLASVTDRQLARAVEYLQTENKILRAKLPNRITLTTCEKAQLVKLGTTLGSTLKNIITIVSYRTFTRWTAAANDTKAKTESTRKPGRPKTAEDIRKQILQLANDNGWGYTRILGELKKLGIHNLSRSTVVNILKDAELDPGPNRTEGSWSDFVKRHAATLWASDFISVRTLTASGVVELYLLFFIHVGSRRVIISAPTANPDSLWVTQQARNASMQMAEWNLSMQYLTIDHDTKYTTSFDSVFEAEQAEIMRVGPKAPNMNPFAERFVQTLRTECLDHFLICGQRHLRYLVNEFVAHYLQERPHQGLGNVPLPDTDKKDDEPTVLPFTLWRTEVPLSPRRTLEALLPSSRLNRGSISPIH